MIQQKIHPDGIWNTTSYPYLDTIIVIKSREGDGMKAHCFYNNEVIFTLRFSFINPDKLLNKMRSKIDDWKSGKWTPKKLKTI